MHTLLDSVKLWQANLQVYIMVNISDPLQFLKFLCISNKWGWIFHLKCVTYNKQEIAMPFLYFMAGLCFPLRWLKFCHVTYFLQVVWTDAVNVLLWLGLISTMSFSTMKRAYQVSSWPRNMVWGWPRAEVQLLKVNEHLKSFSLYWGAGKRSYREKKHTCVSKAHRYMVIGTHVW